MQNKVKNCDLFAQKSFYIHCRVPWVPETFLVAVSGFCQVFIVTRVKSGFGLWLKMCQPSANTENSHNNARKTTGT